MCTVCLLIIISVTFLNHVAHVQCDVCDYIGFGLSTIYQTAPIPPSKVGFITSQINAKLYRIYDEKNGPEITTEIVKQSSTPERIKFSIPLLNLNSITPTVIDNLIANYSHVADNVFLINIGNEPSLAPWVQSWDLLATKLQLVYKHLSTKEPPWSEVKVTIPFSGAIFNVSWPPQISQFKAKYKDELHDVLSVLNEYNGPFSMNLYPFFSLPCAPADCGNDTLSPLQFALGNEMTDGYKSMLEANYDGVLTAVKDIYNGSEVEVLVAETGWPPYSSTKNWSTKANARDFIRNTMDLMNDKSSILYHKKIFFFEFFDEDKKAAWGEWEAYFGIYDVDGKSKGLYSDEELCGDHLRESKKEFWIILCGVLLCVVLMVFAIGGCIWYKKRKMNAKHNENYQKLSPHISSIQIPK